VRADNTREFGIAAITHRGKVRERNEDAVSVCGDLLTGTMSEPFSISTKMEPLIVLVADGMGGHARGDVASRAALKILIDRGSGVRMLSDWVEALHAANHRLYDLMAEDPGVLGLGTTLVGAVLGHRGLVGFNVGDSRLYRQTRRSFVRLSVDDVPLGSTGSKVPRATHQITQSLGGRLTRTAVLPHVNEGAPLEEGERLLLCSDGLTDMLTELEISKVMMETAEPAACVARLLALALESGGRDNISIVVVQAE
jgi:PPM family protein phosphatase